MLVSLKRSFDLFYVSLRFSAFHKGFSSISITSSADLIAKWHTILSPQLDSQHSGQEAHSRTVLHTEQLRQLCQDAIHVYSTEGATTVVPDSVTDIFMGAYHQLQAPERKLRFFKMLVSEFGVQGRAIEEAVQLWLQRAPAGPVAAQGPASPPLTSSLSSSCSSTGEGAVPAPLVYRLAERLSAASQPLYMQLLLPVSQHKAGIHFLVNLRADLLTLLREQPAHEVGQCGVALRALDQHLRSALARWFSLGLLQLHRITWEHSPGQLLQRVQQTEAVHKMAHMEELQRRLQQSDRRVFAFMHPSLPGEPLVVLHTAITDHIPGSMDVVLAQQPTNRQQAAGGGSIPGSSGSSHSRRSADDGRAGSDDGSSQLMQGSVACFYSISSSQQGLSGVDLGNFLIKKAAQLLLSELPQLQTLVTLSPIPGFRAWLISKLRQEATGGDVTGDAPILLQESEQGAVLEVHSAVIQAASGRAGGSSIQQATHGHPCTAGRALLQLVQDNSWANLLQQQQEGLRPVLLRLCAVYLLLERRRNFALDPVAHFHLRNGAQLWRINWRADMSAQGLSNSCGLMVNYLYDMTKLTTNNQHYLVEHTISATQAVRQLLGPN